jgi:hypothetical protein
VTCTAYRISISVSQVIFRFQHFSATCFTAQNVIPKDFVKIRWTTVQYYKMMLFLSTFICVQTDFVRRTSAQKICQVPIYPEEKKRNIVYFVGPVAINSKETLEMQLPPGTTDAYLCNYCSNSWELGWVVVLLYQTI